ncbi:hypothetical protein N9D84_04195 [Planktomarina temperata]|nr:hypothetical protein [Planktomarina temperata]
MIKNIDEIIIKISANMMLFFLLFNYCSANIKNISLLNYLFVVIHVLLLFVGVGVTGYGGHQAGIENLNFGYKGMFISGNELNIYLLVLIAVSHTLEVKLWVRMAAVSVCGLAALLTLSKVGFAVFALSFIYIFALSGWISRLFLASAMLSLTYINSWILAPMILLYERQMYFYDRFQSYTFLLSGRLERLKSLEVEGGLINYLTGPGIFSVSNYELDFVNIIMTFGLLGGSIIIIMTIFLLRKLGVYMLGALLILSNLSGHIFYYSGVTISLFVLISVLGDNKNAKYT